MTKILITALTTLAFATPSVALEPTYELETEQQQRLNYQIGTLEDRRQLEAVGEQRRQDFNQSIPRVLESAREMRDSQLWQTADEEWQRQQEAPRDMTNKIFHGVNTFPGIGR